MAIVEPVDVARSGTFSPNLGEPLHGWYPYLEGYSRGLVEDELIAHQGIRVVYDPFGGSGTTPLVAVINGLTGLYSEINPVMQLIARVKTEAARLASQNQVDLELLAVHAQTAASAKWGHSPHDSFGEFNRFFSPEAAASLAAFKRTAMQETDEVVRGLLLVALAAVAVPSSLMIRRGDLRFATQTELTKRTDDVGFMLSNKLREMGEDLESLGTHTVGDSHLVSADVRDAELSAAVDAIVTSPPYLNGTNYFRNTKLELRLLDFIESESELGGLYQKGITAGINNVSRRRTYTNAMSDDVECLVRRLEQEAYDSRIPLMVRGYFSDMQDAITSMHAALRPGGTLSFDIGDSQFAGVHVPTHSILDAQIQRTGLVKLDEAVLRTRRSRNGMLLSQRVMRYRKPELDDGR